MSRARPINLFGDQVWFDTQQNGQHCKVAHLELLASAENISIDDLLDESLNQGELIKRLRKALDQGVIPPEILERHRQRKAEAASLPQCRICGFGIECEGTITRHHFVPRWMMLQLDNYSAYSSRSLCTIPICVSKHRDLHSRGDEDKSIIQYLTDSEKQFAQRMLEDLEEQHPKIFKLLAAGDKAVYEAQLIKDYLAGSFTHQEDATSERDAGVSDSWVSGR